MADTAKILKALGAIGATLPDGEPPESLPETVKTPTNRPRKSLEMDVLVNACMPEGVPVFGAGLPEA